MVCKRGKEERGLQAVKEHPEERNAAGRWAGVGGSFVPVQDQQCSEGGV